LPEDIQFKKITSVVTPSTLNPEAISAFVRTTLPLAIQFSIKIVLAVLISIPQVRASLEKFPLAIQFLTIQETDESRCSPVVLEAGIARAELLKNVQLSTTRFVPPNLAPAAALVLKLELKSEFLMNHVFPDANKPYVAVAKAVPPLLDA
jgi:hypothetical protein